MELDQNRDRYILTEKEKRALVWRIERYKQKDLKYLPLNYKISQEMEEILLFIEELANSTRELQQCITIASMQEFDNLKPYFKTTTPETTIRNWITEFRKQKNTFRAK